MKYKITVISLLAMSMVFCLCGCKSQEVINVESMIGAIGEVTLDKGSVIEDAQVAYENLSPADASKVENYDILVEASSKYQELVKNEEIIIDAQNTCKEITDCLQTFDAIGMLDGLDKLEILMNQIPSDRQSEIQINASEMREMVSESCYPETKVWKLPLVVGSSHVQSEKLVDGRYFYECSSEEAAENVFDDFHAYIKKANGFTTDFKANKFGVGLTYSYGDGHVEFYILGSTVVVDLF